MARILLIDHHKTTHSVLAELLMPHELLAVSVADKALFVASEQEPDLVVVELSLAGHSGLEFLYEFRTYTDWEHVPIIIYTTIRLSNEVLSSKAWEQLKIQAYLYKPETTLHDLKEHVALALATRQKVV